ncbi:hypothetical protein QUF70_13170 [Desulfobacterales bacterium HSG17]|nr:hypothetical protein [Desulfobacterales bacterium HSG17]
MTIAKKLYQLLLWLRMTFLTDLTSLKQNGKKKNYVHYKNSHEKTKNKSNPALNSDAKGFRSLSLPTPFCAG